ncbi:sensor histidine kinase [Nocardia thailandica]|uniref:sensor histidine kinase n=1 Tax=Nocardia thailandica TaxID=257275 RepID=UPI000309484E|nr:ATP-binding protein [Nocardia thailandica]
MSVAAADINHAASEQILRRLGVSVGIGALIVMALESPEVINQVRQSLTVWSIVQVALAFAMFVPLALTAWRGPFDRIRPVAAGAAVCFLLAAAMNPLIYTETMRGTFASWPYRAAVLGVLAAALAWPVPVAVGYAAILTAVTTASNAVVVPESSTASVVGDYTRALGLTALFLWCVAYARSVAERVDRETGQERATAAALAASAAAERERARFAGLIHDAVLSTLLDAARTTRATPRLRAQAADTLGQLDMAAVATVPDRLDATAAVASLRDAVHAVCPDIEVAAAPPRGAELAVPTETVHVLGAALAEAVRNSVRHAGADARRAVTVTIGAGGIRVVLRDDGAGFDPARVPADRMGVAVSIRGRMSRLAGGAAFVESSPGQGTTVTLVWGSDG